MKIITTKNWTLKAKLKHGNKCDYSKVEYVNARTKVCIICPEHGEFWQTPNNHMNGQNCPDCGKIMTIKGKQLNCLNKRDWDFEQPEDYKLIPLTKGKFAMVDNEDFDILKGVNWYFDGKYVKNNTLGYMHRYIMNAKPDLEVDHIYHNTLDNRKKNIRLVTRAQNTANSKHRKECSSKYKGVCFNKIVKKWVCSLMFKGVVYNLGYFTDEKEAGKAYDLKALELFGEFAYLNFPELKEEYLKTLR